MRTEPHTLHKQADVLTLFLTGAGLRGFRKRTAVSPRPVENGVMRKSLTLARNLWEPGTLPSFSSFTTLAPGADYQTPPNLTWVWLIMDSLFRACKRYRSWRSEAKPFCSLFRITCW